MTETKSGAFIRSRNPFVEVEGYRRDSYSTFIKRAAHKLSLHGQKGKYVSLFRLNGARVLDEEVTVKGKTKPWTLGNYLLLMKKSPNHVKMGIGYVSIINDDFPESSCGSEVVLHAYKRFKFIVILLQAEGCLSESSSEAPSRKI